MIKGMLEKEDADIKRQVMEKELDLIQGCINRMAKNSFDVKKWTVGLISILTGILQGKNIGITGSILLGMIVVIFWRLDGFFLRIEKLYRKKYEWILVNRIGKDKWEYIYDLNPYNENMFIPTERWKKIDDLTVFAVMCSDTLKWFYILMILLCFTICFAII